MLILACLIQTTIVTQKEIVRKRCKLFCLCYSPALTSARLFRNGTKCIGKFQKHKFKYKVFGRNII